MKVNEERKKKENEERKMMEEETENDQEGQSVMDITETHEQDTAGPTDTPKTNGRINFNKFYKGDP